MAKKQNQTNGSGDFDLVREKYALKALRGDFDGIAGEDFAGSEHDAEKVDEMIEAVKA